MIAVFHSAIHYVSETTLTVYYANEEYIESNGGTITFKKAVDIVRLAIKKATSLYGSSIGTTTMKQYYNGTGSTFDNGSSNLSTNEGDTLKYTVNVNDASNGFGNAMIVLYLA